MKSRIIVAALIAASITTVTLVPALASAPASRVDPGGTPPQLVETYDALADTILASKKAEWRLVHAILSTTYAHAEAIHSKAQAKLAAGENARQEIELLAGLVAQLGNEGDAAVAAVRKRLVEGGHHHHAGAGDEKKYDLGFVVVTREAKKALLDAAGAIGRMGRAPDAAALKTAWSKVEAVFAKLHEDIGD